MNQQSQNKTEISLINNNADANKGAIAAQELLGDAITNGDHFLVIRVTPGPEGSILMDGTVTTDALRQAEMAISQLLDMFRSRG